MGSAPPSPYPSPPRRWRGDGQGRVGQGECWRKSRPLRRLQKQHRPAAADMPKRGPRFPLSRPAGEGRGEGSASSHPLLITPHQKGVGKSGRGGRGFNALPPAVEWTRMGGLPAAGLESNRSRVVGCQIIPDPPLPELENAGRDLPISPRESRLRRRRQAPGFRPPGLGGRRGPAWPPRFCGRACGRPSCSQSCK